MAISSGSNPSRRMVQTQSTPSGSASRAARSGRAMVAWKRAVLARSSQGVTLACGSHWTSTTVVLSRRQRAAAEAAKGWFGSASG